MFRHIKLHNLITGSGNALWVETCLNTHSYTDTHSDMGKRTINFHITDSFAHFSKSMFGPPTALEGSVL